MAFIDPRQANKDEEDQTRLSSGSAFADGSGSGGSTTSPVAPEPAKPANPAADFQQVQAQNAGRDFGSLLKPYQDKVSAGRTALDSAWNGFQSSLGADDPWDSTETTALDGYIRGGQGKDDARGVLNRSYTGPTTWNAPSELSDLRDYGSSYGDPEHLSSTITSLNPRATRGEARFDALLASQDAGFQSGLKAASDQARGVLDDATSRQTQAGSLIAGRQAQAADVRTRAGQYLSDWRGRLNSDLNTAINAAATADATARGQYDAQAGARPQTAGGKTFDRSQYLTWTPGDTPSRDNVATQAQAGEWNRIAELTGSGDVLTPRGRTAAAASFNSDAWTNALRSVVNDWFGTVESARSTGKSLVDSMTNNPTQQAIVDQRDAFLRAADARDFGALLDYAKGVDAESRRRIGIPSGFYNTIADAAAQRGLGNLVDPNARLYYASGNNLWGSGMTPAEIQAKFSGLDGYNAQDPTGWYASADPWGKWQNALNDTHRSRVASSLGYTGNANDPTAVQTWLNNNPNKTADFIQRTLDYASAVDAWNKIYSDTAKVQQIVDATGYQGDLSGWADWMNQDWGRWQSFNNATRRVAR